MAADILANGAVKEMGGGVAKVAEALPVSPVVNLGNEASKFADINPDAGVKMVASTNLSTAELTGPITKPDIGSDAKTINIPASKVDASITDQLDQKSAQPINNGGGVSQEQQTTDRFNEAAVKYVQEGNNPKTPPESKFIVRRGEPRQGEQQADLPTPDESTSPGRTSPDNPTSTSSEQQGGISEVDDLNGTTPFPEVDQDKTQGASTQSEKSSTAAEPAKPAPGSEEERTALGLDAPAESGKSNDKDSATSDEQETKRQQELQSLEAKIADKSITPEEYEKYQKLREPDRRMQELDKKVKDGTATADELNEWKNGPEPEDVDSRTPEQVEADLEKSLDETSLRIAEKFANGDFTGAEKDIVNFKQELAESQGLSVSDENVKNIRSFLEILAKPEKAGNPRETAKMRNIREKLQEVAKMEMQVRNLAETVKKMKDQEEKLKDGVNQSEADYMNESDPEKKQQKLIIWSGKTMQLAGFQESIKVQKRLGRDLRIKQRETAGYIHRKLGTKTVWQNIRYGIGTDMTQLGYGIANNYDSLFSFA